MKKTADTGDAVNRRGVALQVLECQQRNSGKPPPRLHLAPDEVPVQSRLQSPKLPKSAALWIGLTAFSVMPGWQPYPLSGCLCAQGPQRLFSNAYCLGCLPGHLDDR
jgi:hypothetical protein